MPLLLPIAGAEGPDRTSAAAEGRNACAFRHPLYLRYLLPVVSSSLGCRCARALRAAGVGKGDRVAGVMVNSEEALVCMLGVTAVGAIWRCVSGLVFSFGVCVKSMVKLSPLFSSLRVSRLGGAAHPTLFDSFSV